MRERTLTAGEDLLQRAQAASTSLQREEQRPLDPLLEPASLRTIVDDIAEIAQENVHLRIVAIAAREMLQAEYEDETYFAREKLKASVDSWEAWETERDAG